MLEKVYKQIDINKIEANENQPRKVFDDEKIEELATSIKENGLIQPIIVRKYNRNYQIIAGERRFRACKLAGLKTIPCVIKDIDDKQVDTYAIIENIHVDNLFCFTDDQTMAYKYNESKIIKRYRETVNPKINIFLVQTAGYMHGTMQAYRNYKSYYWHSATSFSTTERQKEQQGHRY